MIADRETWAVLTLRQGAYISPKRISSRFPALPRRVTDDASSRLTARTHAETEIGRLLFACNLEAFQKNPIESHDGGQGLAIGRNEARVVNKTTELSRVKQM